MAEITRTTAYNFNYQWKFKLADAFPLNSALEATKDAQGRYFYQCDYEESGWEENLFLLSEMVLSAGRKY